MVCCPRLGFWVVGGRSVFHYFPGKGKIGAQIMEAPMLENPGIPEDLIAARLQLEYGLQVAQIEFLPLGADVNTAVYRLVANDETAYFLKLKKGNFDEISVALPKSLHSQGITAIIAPLETLRGQLWGSLDPYKSILSPFIQGKNGYEVRPSSQQWLDFGGALRQVHTAQIPAELRERIPHERYSPHWRQMVLEFQAQVEKAEFNDSIAADLAEFMRSRRREIGRTVERAGMLARSLASRPLEYVCCHADIHPGNLLIPDSDADDSHGLYIIDWDAPVLSPKEHDLTLIGGCYTWKEPAQTASFYQGYASDPEFGQTGVDRMALAYYRYERIVQDIAAFCEQLLSTDEGGDDREQAYQYFTSIFLPDHEFELAVNTEKAID
jgi:spectinomycin phosphotransferase